MFTSPTILHFLTSSGVRMGWEEDGDDPGLSRRMNVSSEEAVSPNTGVWTRGLYGEAQFGEGEGDRWEGIAGDQCEEAE